MPTSDNDCEYKINQNSAPAGLKVISINMMLAILGICAIFTTGMMQQPVHGTINVTTPDNGNATMSTSPALSQHSTQELNATDLQVQNASDLDLNSQISDVAYQLAVYHQQLAEQALARGDLQEAERHANLGGMTLSQIIGMIEGTLSNESKQKLIESDPGNCIIESNGTVMCLI